MPQVGVKRLWGKLELGLDLVLEVEEEELEETWGKLRSRGRR